MNLVSLFLEDTAQSRLRELVVDLDVRLHLLLSLPTVLCSQRKPEFGALLYLILRLRGPWHCHCAIAEQQQLLSTSASVCRGQERQL